MFRPSTCRSILPGLISGALFAFSVSIDETVISLFMQSPGATTLPVKMFTDIQFNLTPKIAVSSALLVTVATLGLLIQVCLRAHAPLHRPDDAAGRPRQTKGEPMTHHSATSRQPGLRLGGQQGGASSWQRP